MKTIRQLYHRVVVRPMKTTFATSLGAKKAATSVLVKVSLSDGSEGIGEVPTSFVMPHETPSAIAAILDRAREMLIGAGDYPQVLARLRREHERFHMTLSGLEVALFRAGLPAPRWRAEWRHWGGRRRTLWTDITIPFVPDAGELRAWLHHVTPKGFTTYKIKVGGRIDADMAFIKAVREILSERAPNYVIRLDGNQGYTARSYALMIASLEKSGIDIELFEQPLRKDDYTGLRAIRGCGLAPVILDETVFCAADCRRVIDENLGDGVNIKIAKSGLEGSGAIMRLARQAGLKLMVGCMTETMVGLSAGIRLAAGAGVFDYIDLDSIHFLYHRDSFDEIAIDGCRYALEDAP